MVGGGARLHRRLELTTPWSQASWWVAAKARAKASGKVRVANEGKMANAASKAGDKTVSRDKMAKVADSRRKTIKTGNKTKMGKAVVAAARAIG